MDPRVIRTKEKIRQAYITLASEKKPEEIRLVDITGRAGVAKKTFYLHYDDIADVAEEVCEELADEATAGFTGETGADIETLYHWFDSTSEEVRHLVLSEKNLDFKRAFFHRVFGRGAFRHLTRDNALVEGYLMAIPRIYVAATDHDDTHVLAQKMTKLVEHGLNYTTN